MAIFVLYKSDRCYLLRENDKSAYVQNGYKRIICLKIDIACNI